MIDHWLIIWTSISNYLWVSKYIEIIVDAVNNQYSILSKVLYIIPTKVFDKYDQTYYTKPAFEKNRGIKKTNK